MLRREPSLSDKPARDDERRLLRAGAKIARVPRMRFFVTGATGFIGTHLCRALVAEGHSVVALVRNPKKASDLPAQVERFEGDLSTFEDPNRALPACDVFVHMAAVIAARKADDYEAI